MPDIRALLAHLTPEDRQLWAQHRTEMRRSYMTAHNTVLGLAAWTDFDDAFLDLIDTKLTLLFDAAGKIKATELVQHDDANRIEADIHEAISGLKLVSGDMQSNEAVEKSQVTASMQDGAAWQHSKNNQWPNGEMR